MIRKAVMGMLFGFLAACSPQSDPVEPASLDADEKRSGYSFLTPDTQALQDDDFANPGYLWVDRGEALFHEASAGGPSCGSCHEGETGHLKGVAARYPAMDRQSDTLVNLEGRINLCRTRHQNAPALDYESDGLLALTAYVASLSRGMPLSVSVSEQTRSFYTQGEVYFFTRRGQLNLACSQCHNENWGKRLRGDTISQGHGTGFPAYRLEWQTLGSLHRRLYDCDAGVRAEPKDLGSPVYTALEYYLAVRASGLTVEAPGVRR